MIDGHLLIFCKQWDETWCALCAPLLQLSGLLSADVPSNYNHSIQLNDLVGESNTPAMLNQHLPFVQAC